MEKDLFSSLKSAGGPLMVTGHTGFKGAWLIGLLTELGIPAVGYSLAPEKNSLYLRAGLQGIIPEIFSDIRDKKALKAFMNEHQPSNILHMAAQPLVLKSYKEPEDTFSVNVMGTANLVETAFQTDFVRQIGVVTTDKVYKNNNQGKRFVETDPLGGKDPYSASKVCTEEVVAAWRQIARIKGGPKLISLRAGNVIGGGDFAEDRIVPDLVRGYLAEESVTIRNPNSTRPWQHALDPLIGYLYALEKLPNLGAESQSFNFGPLQESLKVSELVANFQKVWGDRSSVNLKSNESMLALEATDLGLDSTLASEILGWSPLMDQLEAMQSTAKWWKAIHEESIDPKRAMLSDIQIFIDRIGEKNLELLSFHPR